MLQELKDKTLALALKALANDRYSEYGTADECDIDTARNRLVLKATLKGETVQVTATIERYEIEKSDEGTFLVIYEITASREWLSVLLKKLAHGKRLHLPAPVAMLL